MIYGNPPLRLFPIWRRCRLKSSGRVCGRDGTPLVGPHPHITNLYINAGHFRNGVVLGPATARVLADHVLRRPATLEQGPYLPENIMDVGTQ